jgi:hypothetical protein
VKFIPQLPTAKQKETRLAATRDLLQCSDQDTNFMKTITTSDESWDYGYDPETKAQSSYWKSPGSPRSKKGMPTSEQDKSDADSFLQSGRHRSP